MLVIAAAWAVGEEVVGRVELLAMLMMAEVRLPPAVEEVRKDAPAGVFVGAADVAGVVEVEQDDAEEEEEADERALEAVELLLEAATLLSREQSPLG